MLWPGSLWQSKDKGCYKETATKSVDGRGRHAYIQGCRVFTALWSSLCCGQDAWVPSNVRPPVWWSLRQSSCGMGVLVGRRRQIPVWPQAWTEAKSCEPKVTHRPGSGLSPDTESTSTSTVDARPPGLLRNPCLLSGPPTLYFARAVWANYDAGRVWLSGFISCWHISRGIYFTSFRTHISNRDLKKYSALGFTTPQGFGFFHAQFASYTCVTGLP